MTAMTFGSVSRLAIEQASQGAAVQRKGSVTSVLRATGDGLAPVVQCLEVGPSAAARSPASSSSCSASITSWPLTTRTASRSSGPPPPIRPSRSSIDFAHVSAGQDTRRRPTISASAAGSGGRSACANSVASPDVFAALKARSTVGMPSLAFALPREGIEVVFERTHCARELLKAASERWEARQRL